MHCARFTGESAEFELTKFANTNNRIKDVAAFLAD